MKDLKYYILGSCVAIAITYCLCSYFGVKYLEKISFDIPTTNIKDVPPIETQMFYKTIDVKITDIELIWHSNFITKWRVKVRSDEYNLEDSFEVDARDYKYGSKLYSGQLKVGDTIQAELLSWVISGNVDKRKLNHLN